MSPRGPTGYNPQDYTLGIVAAEQRTATLVFVGKLQLLLIGDGADYHAAELAIAERADGGGGG